MCVFVFSEWLILHIMLNTQYVKLVVPITYDQNQQLQQLLVPQHNEVQYQKFLPHHPI